MTSSHSPTHTTAEQVLLDGDCAWQGADGADRLSSWVAPAKTNTGDSRVGGRHFTGVISQCPDSVFFTSDTSPWSNRPQQRSGNEKDKLTAISGSRYCVWKSQEQFFEVLLRVQRPKQLDWFACPKMAALDMKFASSCWCAKHDHGSTLPLLQSPSPSHVLNSFVDLGYFLMLTLFTSFDWVNSKT